MKKNNITFPFLLITLFTSVNIANAQTPEQEKVLKNISGITIKDFGNYNAKTSQAAKEESLRLEQEKANSNLNLNNKSSISGEPTPVTGISIPNSPNVGNAQTITPKNVPIPIPQNYLDLQNNPPKQKEITNGQTPPEPIKIKPMTLQEWNTSTIQNLEEKGQEDARKKYNEFRRGIQY